MTLAEPRRSACCARSNRFFGANGAVSRIRFLWGVTKSSTVEKSHAHRVDDGSNGVGIGAVRFDRSGRLPGGPAGRRLVQAEFRTVGIPPPFPFFALPH